LFFGDRRRRGLVLLGEEGDAVVDTVVRDAEAGMTLHFDLDAPARASLDAFAARVRTTLPTAATA